jgi:hypothetical protein
MAAWLLRNLLLVQSLADRPLEQHWITFKQVQRLANTVLLWFVPGRFVHGREFLVLAGLVVVVGGLVFLAVRHRPRQAAGSREHRSAIVRLLGLQIVFHLLVLVVSKSYFDPITPLNDRILAPILPSVLILAIILCSDLWQTGRAPLRLAAAALVLFLACFYLYRTVDLAPRLNASGLGFARKGWHNSQTLAAVRELPAVPLYSNSPASIYMWTGRPAYPIYNLEQMRASMESAQAVLVLFNSVATELYDVSRDDLTAGLAQIAEFKDGALYQQTP